MFVCDVSLLSHRSRAVKTSSAFRAVGFSAAIRGFLLQYKHIKHMFSSKQEVINVSEQMRQCYSDVMPMMRSLFIQAECMNVNIEEYLTCCLRL